jgi:hypothetical protein
MCVIPFNTKFDGTHMTKSQVIEEVRRRGWSGFRLDATAIVEKDIVIVRRVSKRHCDGRP